MKGISDHDYKHAQQVWNRITPEHENITLGDYHDVYLATDVLRRVWDISEYVLKKLQIGSSTFLHRGEIRMAGLIKDSRLVLRTWKKA